MATNPEELAQGAEPEDPNAPPPEGAEDGAPEQDDTPEPVKELAREMGWTPREEYTGPPESFKNAGQFIRDGRDIQRDTSRELKALRQTVETIGRTSAAIVEQTVEQRVNALGAEYNKAVEDGDTRKSFEISGKIHKLLDDTPTNRPSGPTPSAQDFASRNAGWFQKDPLATSLAIEVTNRLAGQGYDEKAQLDAAEREVRRQYPQLFNQRNGFHKPQAGTNIPGSRAPQNNAGRAKGFADMPLEAQKVAEDMVTRGVIKIDDPNKAKAMFAENYWREAGRKA